MYFNKYYIKYSKEDTCGNIAVIVNNYANTLDIYLAMFNELIKDISILTYEDIKCDIVKNSMFYTHCPIIIVYNVEESMLNLNEDWTLLTYNNVEFKI